MRDITEFQVPQSRFWVQRVPEFMLSLRAKEASDDLHQFDWIEPA
jgi:hypothetical protein